MTNKIQKTAEGEGLLDDASNYDKDKYEKPSVTADICICTIDDDKLKVLMIKRKHAPFRGKWACPGGFLEIPKKQTLEQTAVRELEEETGVKGIPVHQLATYSGVKRDPRMRIVTTAYFACVDSSVIERQNIKAADDADDYIWMNLKDLPKLAFDHNKILDDLYERLQGRVVYADIAFQFVAKEFTWSELQHVYEVILDRKLITPNFRRKIKKLYYIEETKRMSKPERGRPSKLLRFNGIKPTFDIKV
jgi:8-oxo-dGTP diphosphatase